MKKTYISEVFADISMAERVMIFPDLSLDEKIEVMEGGFISEADLKNKTTTRAAYDFAQSEGFTEDGQSFDNLQKWNNKGVK